MPAHAKHKPGGEIRGAVPARSRWTVIVRTPEEMRRRLADGDLFHTEIVSGAGSYMRGTAQETRAGEGCSSPARFVPSSRRRNMLPHRRSAVGYH
jgi:hypothetical protein